MQAELEALSRALETPARPLVAIVGGAKVSTKLDLLGNLLAKVDQLIIGGAMANTFLAALGKPVGKSLAEHDLAGTARDILSKAKSLGRDIVLPLDVVVAQKFEAHAPSKVLDVDHVGADDMILDIGPRSVEHVVSTLARAKTLVWNGPFGAFEKEPFDNGTIEVAEAAEQDQTEPSRRQNQKIAHIWSRLRTVRRALAFSIESRLVQWNTDQGRRMKASLSAALVGAVIIGVVSYIVLPAVTHRLTPTQVAWLRHAFLIHPMRVLSAIVGITAVLGLPVLMVGLWAAGVRPWRKT